MEQAPSLPGRFESALLPVTAATTSFVVYHGRGQPPRQVRWKLVCVRPDNGFIPGDAMDALTGNNLTTLTIWDNAAQIGLTGSAGLNSCQYNNKNTTANFTITIGSWLLQCVADF